MERMAETQHPIEIIESELLSVASEYRRISALLADVAERCGEETIARNQVLEITFTHVVSYIIEGANQIECASRRLSGRRREGLAPSRSEDLQVPIEGRPAVMQRENSAPETLRDTAFALESAMKRALDLIDEAGGEDVMGDSHPFGHVIQGICLPYILLAAETLDGRLS